MKKIKTLIILTLFIAINSCDKMDDNYKEYLELQRTYSPKVTNLSAQAGLKTATLTWDNPQGDIAQKIMVDYQDDSLTFETMVDSVTITDLEIKGYNISVYTIDAFNNYSVPATIQIFPNGENN
ncbi:MAG TPA: DUF4998 domain-containing protein [Tangfeifania sp.]|nr:DUF4998 domain-containing protein [Tangfeifania sp.]